MSKQIDTITATVILPIFAFELLLCKFWVCLVVRPITATVGAKDGALVGAFDNGAFVGAFDSGALVGLFDNGAFVGALLGEIGALVGITLGALGFRVGMAVG